MERALKNFLNCEIGVSFLRFKSVEDIKKCRPYSFASRNLYNLIKIHTLFWGLSFCFILE